MNFVNETEKQAYYIAKCKEIISNREKIRKKIKGMCSNIWMSDEFQRFRETYRYS